MSITAPTPITDFVLQHEGRDVFVSISPCSWMTTSSGLQIKLSAVDNACNAESIFDLDRTVSARSLPIELLLEAAREQALRWLEANGVAPLDDEAAKWAAARIPLEAAVKRSQERMEQARRKRLKKRQAKGYTHVVDAWIHPKGGGDDYRVEACTEGEPTEEDLQLLLAESEIKTDFTVTLIDDILKKP